MACTGTHLHVAVPQGIDHLFGQNHAFGLIGMAFPGVCETSLDLDVGGHLDLGERPGQLGVGLLEQLIGRRTQVEMHVHLAGDHHRRVGVHGQLTAGRVQVITVLISEFAQCHNNFRCSVQGILTVGDGGGAGMGLSAQHRDLVLVGSPGGGHHTHQHTGLVQLAALLDVDLGVRRDSAAAGGVVVTDGEDVAVAEHVPRAQRLRHGGPVGVGGVEGGLQGDLPGEDATALHRRLETGALLVEPVDHCQVVAGMLRMVGVVATQPVHRVGGGEHTVRTVEAPTAWLTVQMGSREHVGRSRYEFVEAEHVADAVVENGEPAIGEPPAQPAPVVGIGGCRGLSFDTARRGGTEGRHGGEVIEERGVGRRRRFDTNGPGGVRSGRGHDGPFCSAPVMIAQRLWARGRE